MAQVISKASVQGLVPYYQLSLKKLTLIKIFVDLTVCISNASNQSIMKKLTILIVSTIILQATVFSQSCLPEGITFSTQAEIDSFQINYPGCTKIEGDVVINGDNITNLLGLNVLNTIESDLEIDLNPLLNNLSGLDSLSYVAGHVWILDNSSLFSIANLNNLQYVGSLYIAYNESLIDLTGLNDLDSIGNSLSITDNEILNSLTGLENLSYIGSYLSIGSSMYSSGNPALIDLSGLVSLASIGGNLSIHNNNSLNNLVGLNNLVSIGGTIWISNNYSLDNLDGLNNLSSMGESLWINSNYSLCSLDALDNINPESIVSLWISGNSSLTSCEAQSICSYLANPNGVVKIYNNAAGCNNPGEVAGACGFTLACLPFGDYFFYSQSEVDNFQANYLGCTNLNGNVHINGSDITNLNGLNTLSSAEWLLIGGLYDGNPILTELSGLENLESVGGSFYILSNDSLSDICALSSLTFVDEELRIEHNPCLTSLTGLDNIDAGCLILLSVYGNSSLSTCEVQSVCDFLAIPNASINIQNNETGCNSQEEVETACQIIWVSETNPEDKFTIYPNPTKGQITVSNESELSITEIIVYNQLGQKVLHKTQSTKIIDVSMLKQGIYIIEINSNKLKIREKLIVSE